MAHNGSKGAVHYDPARDMRFYDDLPRPIRDHMKDCLENWALTDEVADWIDRDGIGHVLQSFKAGNHREFERREKQRARAAGPWKGNAPLVPAVPKRRRHRRSRG
jgi:hypothetical protein